MCRLDHKSVRDTFCHVVLSHIGGKCCDGAELRVPITGDTKHHLVSAIFMHLCIFCCI